MSKRKQILDREAGLVFSWRTRDRSQGRVIFAFAISVLFWLALLGMVRVAPLQSAAHFEREVDLTFINLNDEKNRWLEEAVKRDIPFPNRWELLASADAKNWIDEAVAQAEPSLYGTKYPEVADFKMSDGLNLQAVLGRWDLPEAERVVRKKAVSAGNLEIHWHLAGSAEKVGFSWKLPEDSGFSVGQQFRYYVGLDENGAVQEALPLLGGLTPRQATDNFFREKMKSLVFPELSGNAETRWFYLEGKVEAEKTP